MIQKSCGHQFVEVGSYIIPLFTGCFASQVVQDFFHQQYHVLANHHKTTWILSFSFVYRQTCWMLLWQERVLAEIYWIIFSGARVNKDFWDANDILYQTMTAPVFGTLKINLSDVSAATIQAAVSFVVFRYKFCTFWLRFRSHLSIFTRPRCEIRCHPLATGKPLSTKRDPLGKSVAKRITFFLSNILKNEGIWRNMFILFLVCWLLCGLNYLSFGPPKILVKNLYLFKRASIFWIPENCSH